jgi:hypothetical protein
MQKKPLYIILFLLTTGFTLKPQSVADEYNLKAAFLYNFTRYIEWTPETNTQEFVIGVVGTSAIYDPLEDIANSKTVNGKRIVIRVFTNPEDITFCHILFVSRSANFPLIDIMEKARVKGTLIVTEKNGLAAQGAAINFIIVENKLKFEANTKSIKKADLKVSSQLLKLAILIE